MKKILIITLMLFFTQSVLAMSSNQIQVGDRVIDQYNDAGIVKEIYSNGKTKIQFDGAYGYIGLADRSINKLSKSFRCVNNACVGDRVIENLFNYTGTIVEVFSNGQAKIRLDGIIGKIGLADRSLTELGF